MVPSPLSVAVTGPPAAGDPEDPSEEEELEDPEAEPPAPEPVSPAQAERVSRAVRPRKAISIIRQRAKRPTGVEVREKDTAVSSRVGEHLLRVPTGRSPPGVVCTDAELMDWPNKRTSVLRIEASSSQRRGKPYLTASERTHYDHGSCPNE